MSTESFSVASNTVPINIFKEDYSNLSTWTSVMHSSDPPPLPPSKGGSKFWLPPTKRGEFEKF